MGLGMRLGIPQALSASLTSTGTKLIHQPSEGQEHPPAVFGLSNLWSMGPNSWTVVYSELLGHEGGDSVLLNDWGHQGKGSGFWGVPKSLLATGKLCCTQTGDSCVWVVSDSFHAKVSK